ncbi:nucleotidyltransferase domain-containing protein [Hazenella sp. IB182353]|uniref:DNA polymerase beta superfamily protein n=1 Tax=Polycladospora coralii TaxID=2771432 RepID=UPI0017471195|nr:nucleotidyltransferase domain-containing protein [Polycladospora coralii]
MKKKITEKLRQIERDFGVKVLYACESGSRAWGFPSQNSDFDVRFIYVHQPEWYLSIDMKRDVIELPIDEWLDINGWELRKTLQLFRKSNPPLMEWLHSSMVYEFDETFVKEIKEMAHTAFSPISCIHHYLHMAKGNYRDYLKQEKVRVKKYFYVLRPLLACQYIEQYRQFPPLEFPFLVEQLLPQGELKEKIEQLLIRKHAGEKLDVEARISLLNAFIEERIHHYENSVKKINSEPVDITNKLDSFFQKTVKKHAIDI